MGCYVGRGFNVGHGSRSWGIHCVGSRAMWEWTIIGTGFCRIFATELEDQRPKTVPYLEEVVGI